MTAPKLIPATPALARIRSACAALAPLVPALLYLLGLLALVFAAFLLDPIAGFAAAGASLIIVGYMVEVNLNATSASRS